MYYIIKRGMKAALLAVAMLYSMAAVATVGGPLLKQNNISTTSILAHPPVTGDCISCHPTKERPPPK